MSDKYNYGKDYFRLKMQERRTKNPLLQKKYVYVVEIDGKKYAFKQKYDIPIQRMSIKNQNFKDCIKCF